MSTTTPHGSLHQRVIAWYDLEARDLPWRGGDRSAWGVLVSEIMLQQTPVVRVLPVWQEWMERWPAASSLAADSAGEAVRRWGRLGYPRRALRLHAAAISIVEEHSGQVPGSYSELLKLPGVGSYTAAAVAAFAFGHRETVIDTNIRRVQARLVGGDALAQPSLTAAETRRATELLPVDAQWSVRWNSAVMELGAVLCTARSPRCGQCPVLDSCAWVQAGKPAPAYIPKGQPWAGTDRQVRGAIMAVLRQCSQPLPPELLLGTPVDLAVGPTLFAPAPELGAAVAHLHSLGSPSEQLERALAGLLRDGLAEETTTGVQLPTNSASAL